VLSPYGLDTAENCLTCQLGPERLLRRLSAQVLTAFEDIKYATACPKGAVLFVEGPGPMPNGFRWSSTTRGSCHGSHAL